MVLDPPHDEDLCVRHLVELGYVDPAESAFHDAQRRRQLETELQYAIDLAKQGRAGEAVEPLKRLAGMYPDAAPPRQLLAEIHFSVGNLAAADDDLQWLTHHSVVTPRLAMMAAAIALERGDAEAARHDLEYACHVEPSLAGVQSLLGTAHLRLRHWELAEDCFNQAIGRNPGDARGLAGLATVALHRRRFEEAADWALQALEHDMRLYRAHYCLGIALACLDRPDAAREAFAAASRLDSSQAAPLCWLSRIARKQGDLERAAAYRAQALAIIRRRRSRARRR